MNWVVIENIIVIFLVVLSVLYFTIRIARNMSKKKFKCDDCAGCSLRFDCKDPRNKK